MQSLLKKRKGPLSQIQGQVTGLKRMNQELKVKFSKLPKQEAGQKALLKKVTGLQKDIKGPQEMEADITDFKKELQALMARLSANALQRERQGGYQSQQVENDINGFKQELNALMARLRMRAGVHGGPTIGGQNRGRKGGSGRGESAEDRAARVAAMSPRHRAAAVGAMPARQNRMSFLRHMIGRSGRNGRNGRNGRSAGS